MAAPDQQTATLNVTSSAFNDGEPIPRRHTADGQDVSPPLTFSDVPEAAESLAIVMDDPDAPRDEPWVHWLVYNIPADTHRLAEDVPQKGALREPAGALQGVNSFDTDNIGYRGPAPPQGHGTHHYHFKVYALDQTLDLESGATKQQLLDAMQGHVLAEGELVGTYER